MNIETLSPTVRHALAMLEQMGAVPAPSTAPEAPAEPEHHDLTDDFRTAAKTAIVRRTVSAPLKIALSRGLVKGRTLNFGKGRANEDTGAIEEITGETTAEFDFVHAPFTDVLGKRYETVYAGYVVNVLPPRARAYTWAMIGALTAGTALVAARSENDTALKKVRTTGKAEADGYRTRIGTFQRAYSRDELVAEAREHFHEVTPVASASGFHLVACRHPVQR